MKKLGKDKMALVLACMSILGGKTSAMNKSESPKTVAAVGGAAFGNQVNPGFNTKKVSINQNSQRFGTKEKLIAAGSILASLGIGVVGDRVVSNIFSDYSKGKKIAIKYFQGNEVDSIDFNFGFVGFGKNFNAYEAVDLINPELKDEKKAKTACEFSKYFYKFYDDYLYFLATKYYDIALKHKFIVDNNVFKEDFRNISNLIVKVQPGEDEKLFIRIYQKGEDVTEGFINVEKDNGKAFIDDLEKFVNSDDVMKQILLGGKNKEKKD